MARDDDAVHRYRLPGLDYEDVVLLDVLGCDGGLLAVPHDSRRLWCKVQKPVDRVRGAPLCPGLEELAKGYEGEDGAGSFEVEVMRELSHHGQVVVPEAVCNLVQRIDAVQHGCPRAECDQRIHVRRAVEQRLEAVRVVSGVYDNDHEGKQEEGEGVDHGVLRSQEEGGQRPAHHVSHGYVEQGHGEDDRPGEAPLHRQIRLACRIPRLAPSGTFDCILSVILQGGSIAGLGDGVHYVVAGQGVLIVVHAHGVLEKIHRACVHAG